MNKFKRLFALLLALAMVFALVACGEKDEEDEKKSKEEKFLSEVEDLMDEIIEAIEDGDQDKAEELYKELDDLEDEYDEILEELEEDDEDKAEEFAEDFEKLFEKFEEHQEEAISSDDGDKEPSKKEEDDDGKKDEVQRPVANKNNNITGTWVYNIDLSDAVAAKMVEELGMDIAPDTAMYMNLTLQFDDGNAFTLSAELDRDSFEAYFNDLLVAMIDVMYEMAEEQGSPDLSLMHRFRRSLA